MAQQKQRRFKKVTRYPHKRSEGLRRDMRLERILRSGMPSKRFEISYPDGSKKKVSAFRFEQMRSSGEVKHVGNKHIFVGPSQTFHSFVDLAQWQTQQILNPEQMRRYLERLEVIKALARKREWEREETPEGFEARLIAMGMPENGFSEAGA